ncbi:NADH-dependent [FeFe] hydrogenase, group A6 [Spirochaetia bacterium 38H-sp]|uniref:NADH-dependent [FeFe] hydrogenase, group A6 n=1 Tax=Rarispira pelagica TaxID=3141764 RepID=A0ABU9UCS2_9SPIR
MVNIKINGKELKVSEGTSILNAARHFQIDIPTLCYHPDLPAWGSCGLCIVKTEGSPKMFRACATPVAEGMSIITDDPEIVEVRKNTLQLILADHPNDCLYCGRNGNCELQKLAAEFGIREQPYEPNPQNLPKDNSTPSIVLDPSKCVKCGRCVNVCQEMQNVWALEFLGRGDGTRIAPAGDIYLNDSPCIKCGQCSAHCPVGAIYEKDDTRKVWDAIRDPEIHTVVQIAPAVRVAIGEAFGYEPGTLLTGKTYAALRRLGFDTIFDTNFAADLTIMEEASEFVKRFLEGKGEIPLVTTCCPSWVDYLEKYFPDMIPHFSTAKSPQMMMASMIKTYYAQKAGIDPAKIVVVSVMPCTSKKYEINRDEDMYSSGYKDLDISITTRELARMIKSAGIEFSKLPDEEADSPLGMYTGAGTIFGATGGVMEAAIRTAYYFVTGKEMGEVEYTPVRGLEGVKESELDIDGTKVKIAVAHSISNVEYVLNKVKEAKAAGKDVPYHFIEVMACRGGCVGGGGQPYGATDAIRAKRTAGIYADDKKSEIRCSHQNPAIKKLYEEFLGEPLGEKAHKYLHTHYTPRPLYQK